MTPINRYGAGPIGSRQREPQSDPVDDNPLAALHRLGDPGGQLCAAERPRPPEASPKGTVVLGYATISGSVGGVNSRELKEQAETIADECERRGLALLELVSERAPHTGKAIERPGLSYALQRISSREAQGLVVSELSRLTRSAAELGAILKWLARSNARLVTVTPALDTADEGGTLAANMLIEVERLSQRTRKGLQATRQNGRATGPPAVTDDPDLSEQIAHMRDQGMTLPAIADRLNEDDPPTVRGRAK